MQEILGGYNYFSIENSRQIVELMHSILINISWFLSKRILYIKHTLSNLVFKEHPSSNIAKGILRQTS